MIAMGTKIELKAPMGVFTNIGEVCEVKNIMSDGTICFQFSRGLGYMSYDEFEKYFKEYKEPVKAHKKPWTEWKHVQMEYVNIAGNKTSVPIKYRYNHRRVDLRTDYKEENLKVRVSCYKDDKFILSKGVQLGCARLKLKLFTRELEEMKNNM